jgi:hypothetical protein
MPLGLSLRQSEHVLSSVELGGFDRPISERQVERFTETEDRWGSPAFASGVIPAGVDDPVPAIEEDDPFRDCHSSGWIGAKEGAYLRIYRTLRQLR